MRTARRAATWDTVERLLASGTYAAVVVATNRAEVALQARQEGAIAVPMPTAGGLAALLVDVAARFGAQGLLCLGGAAAPLLDASSFAEIAARLQRPGIWANNPQSADMTAFAPATLAQALLPGPLYCSDNQLAVSLSERTGLPLQLLPLETPWICDFDTPTELLMMEGHPHLGPHLASFLATIDWPRQRRDAVLSALADHPYTELALIGRVPPHAVAFLNAHLRLRIRVFSEERGMKALGRTHEETVRSLLGYFVESVGLPAFLQALGQVADAVLWDTRPLWAHLGLHWEEELRFRADLGDAENRGEEWFDRWQEALAAAPLPILCGGHALVSGAVRFLPAQLPKTLHKEHASSRDAGGCSEIVT
ncbi:MAG: hypothetical protein IMW91_07895 [Firmicutes bacterium]|nr:hypothetical protein [Bacillota bacterium]